MKRVFNGYWQDIFTNFMRYKSKRDNYNECIGFSYSFCPQTEHKMCLHPKIFDLKKAAAMFFWYNRADSFDKSILKYFKEYERCIDESHLHFNSNYGVYAYKNKGLMRCVERLIGDRNSRHAMFLINSNGAMDDDEIDKLCTNAIHFAIDSNDCLQMVVQMRSSNFITLLPYDAFMFSVFYMQVFKELIKHYNWLHIGMIKMQVASLHYYDSDLCNLDFGKMSNESQIIPDFYERNCEINLIEKLSKILTTDGNNL